MQEPDNPQFLLSTLLVLEQGEEQAGLFPVLATVPLLSGHGPCLLHLLSHVCFISPHGVQLGQELYKQESISPPLAWLRKGGRERGGDFVADRPRGSNVPSYICGS